MLSNEAIEAIIKKDKHTAYEIEFILGEAKKGNTKCQQFYLNYMMKAVNTKTDNLSNISDDKMLTFISLLNGKLQNFNKNAEFILECEQNKQNK